MKKGYYIFPFSLVEKGSKIVIYGAGEIGNDFINQIERTKYCKILFLVDKNYNNVKKIGGYDVLPANILKSNEFDNIIVATIKYKNDILQTLNQINLDPSKIVCCDDSYFINENKLIDYKAMDTIKIQIDSVKNSNDTLNKTTEILCNNTHRGKDGEQEYFKLHFGPGSGWIKPDKYWLTLDIDQYRADIVLDFNKNQQINLPDNSVACIYGSHIFEHLSIFAAPKVFAECYRLLKNGGYLRIVIPDVRKSIEEYLKGNKDYELFKRRIEFLKKRFGFEEVSTFEALKGDFISATSQIDLLGSEKLAHQNSWDFEAMVCELVRAGFNRKQIQKMSFKKSNCGDFNFEGNYKSEANESYRSLYIEVEK